MLLGNTELIQQVDIPVPGKLRALPCLKKTNFKHPRSMDKYRKDLVIG
jgi:hypothetical protein